MNSYSVCVFCSASVHLPEMYFELARQFGARVAREGYRLVYGGGGRGLMGSAARAAVDAGGAVLGVMPEVLVRREELATLGENVIVDSLAERKAKMAEASHAFVALPGGIGTLDEVTEMITWNELGVHTKPVLLLNKFGFWDPLLEFFRRGRSVGVIRPGFEAHYAVVDTLDELFERLQHSVRAAVSIP